MEAASGCYGNGTRNGIGLDRPSSPQRRREAWMEQHHADGGSVKKKHQHSAVPTQGFRSACSLTPSITNKPATQPAPPKGDSTAIIFQ